MVYRLIIFLIINFVGLGLSSYFMGSGATSDWYLSLNRAPWTPPGWMFGAAWTTIMVFFAFFMAYLWKDMNNKTLVITLFIVQWILNTLWTPVFFRYQMIACGLVVILLLTATVLFLYLHYFRLSRTKSAFILPYLAWLIIADSLNAYIYLYN